MVLINYTSTFSFHARELGRYINYHTPFPFNIWLKIYWKIHHCIHAGRLIVFPMLLLFDVPTSLFCSTLLNERDSSQDEKEKPDFRMRRGLMSLSNPFLVCTQFVTRCCTLEARRTHETGRRWPPATIVVDRSSPLRAAIFRYMLFSLEII